VATDEELLTAWRAGDTRAGDVFVRRMFGPIRRFFASKVAGEVEELVQQTFARVVEARMRFEGRSSPRTFVYGIARNVLREHYRRRHRSDVDVEDLAVRDMAAGPSTLRWRRREDELLLESLRTLPLKMQIALELFYWDDFTAREVAEILEIPEGTVASRLGRAKERLRGQFEGGSSAGAPGAAHDSDASLEAWSARIRHAIPLEEPEP
jgi:RNA polymerase sigma factor (sigma-70 family)